MATLGGARTGHSTTPGLKEGTMAEPERRMNRITTEINVGATEPFKLLHISDTHLTLADEREIQRKLDLAEKRKPHFKTAESDLLEAENIAKETGAIMVHTGDIIDFVSYANLERAKEFVDNTDCFFAAGNHEFSLFVGEAFEDAEYRNQSLERVQEAFRNDIRFSSKKVNGVNLIAIDNSYYRFEPFQLQALKAEVSFNMPVILLLHTPLYEPDLYKKKIANADSAFLVSTPTELMSAYTEYRFKQQLADEMTLEATEYIKNELLIKAIISGHLHFDYEGKVTDRLPQYVTGKNTAREIIVT
ncbi:MAG: metallophosphoesterase [Eubacteriales bacterium]|nr:metallophosphoesterase [Eubacteriales bacterium]